MTGPCLSLSNYRNVVVLTGAGVSVASGLPTYRGSAGLWRDEHKRNLATAEAVQTRPDQVWASFAGMRRQLSVAEPNPAHTAIAQMDHEVAQSGDVVVVTQNVDGLHQRAGSKHVVELHGSLGRTRCTDPSCELSPFDDDTAGDRAPRCELCGAALRPDVVMFDEPLGGAEHLAKRALRDCDLFLSVGTSGTVWPAAAFVRSAKYAGARTISVNPDADRQRQFDEHWQGKAEQLLPALIAAQ